MPLPLASSFGDVVAARKRLQPYVQASDLRNYPQLDQALGEGIHVFVKHENHNPTNSFKVRNAFSALTMLDKEQRKHGVVAASRGNHGQGLAYAGNLLNIPVTICVPLGNNPEKNEAIRSLGANLVEKGKTYDDAIEVAQKFVDQDLMYMVHSTNNRHVLAGAATVSLEIIEVQPKLDAIIMPIGGGSLATGASVVSQALAPWLKVYGVQSELAPAFYESYKAGKMLSIPAGDTIADGVATGAAYEATFDTLYYGLADCLTVSESEIAEAIRLVLHHTHNLVEGAGALGLAGVLKLKSVLEGKSVAVVLSGANIDAFTLRRVLNQEI